MSNTQIQPGGGARPPALATVCTDQITIRGSGSSDDPLHTSGSSAGTVKNAPAVGVSPGLYPPGTALAWSSISHKVANAAARAGSSITQGTVAGLSIVDSKAGFVDYQFDGIVTLTEVQWAAVVDGGVLIPGATYYTSVTTDGNLQGSRPAVSTQVATKIGIALSTTELQLQIGDATVIP